MITDTPVHSFIQEISRSLDEAAARDPVAPRVRRRLRTVVRRCGWQRRTVERMAELEAQLSEAGIHSSIDLEDLDISQDSTVWFSREPALKLDRVFRTEAALAYHLSKYPVAIQRVFPELGKLRLRAGGRLPERTIRFEGAMLRPDLVFRSSTGDTVVAELKRGDPTLSAVGQLELYLRALTSQGSSVVGLLVSATPRRRALRTQVARQMDRLRNQVFDARWVLYDVQVQIRPATSRDGEAGTQRSKSHTTSPR